MNGKLATYEVVGNVSLELYPNPPVSPLTFTEPMEKMGSRSTPKTKSDLVVLVT